MAVEVETLYIAELSIESQQISERIKKARRGMQEVIVRITGNRKSLSNPLVKASLNQPDEFLRVDGLRRGVGILRDMIRHFCVRA